MSWCAESILDPASSWQSYEAYLRKYRSLAARFIDNFKKYADKFDRRILEAGPML